MEPFVYRPPPVIARKEVEVLLDFHCPSCKRVSQATVTGFGAVVSGEAFTDTSDKAFLADIRAQARAASAIKRARCPVCGKRDESVLRAVRMRVVLLLTAAGALGAGAVFLTLRDHAWLLWFFLWALPGLPLLLFAINRSDDLREPRGILFSPVTERGST